MFPCAAAVGVMLIQGQGCEQDERQGLDWLKKSAQGGSLYGQGLLSRHYLAMKLYSKAVEAAFRSEEEPGRKMCTVVNWEHDRYMFRVTCPLYSRDVCFCILESVKKRNHHQKVTAALPRPSPDWTVWAWPQAALCWHAASSWGTPSPRMAPRQ